MTWCVLRPFLAGASVLLLAAAPAKADIVQADDVIITGSLCVGAACINGEVFNSVELKLKSNNLELTFEDSSVGSINPTNDWQLRANDASANNFSIRDLETNANIFRIEAGAPTSSLHVRSSGNVGFGTAFPLANLHIVTSSTTAAIRMEENAGTSQIYELRGDNSGFRLQDISGNRSPFYVNAGAPSNSVNINTSGNVGIGTPIPEGKLHTRGAGTQLAYFESSDGGAVQVRFRTNSENRRFLAVNNANQVQSQIVFGNNQIQFLGQTAAQEWLRVSAAGIVSSGPTCNPNPCDATFDPDAFTVPPIEERAAYMWENMHLPAIGPTEASAPFNVTEKIGGVIHELEIAHIYIEELNTRNAALEARLALQERGEAAMQDQIEELLARLESVEAR